MEQRQLAPLLMSMPSAQRALQLIRARLPQLNLLLELRLRRRKESLPMKQ